MDYAPKAWRQRRQSLTTFVLERAFILGMTLVFAYQVVERLAK